VLSDLAPSLKAVFLQQNRGLTGGLPPRWRASPPAALATLVVDPAVMLSTDPLVAEALRAAGVSVGAGRLGPASAARAAGAQYQRGVSARGGAGSAAAPASPSASGQRPPPPLQPPPAGAPRPPLRLSAAVPLPKGLPPQGGMSMYAAPARAAAQPRAAVVAPDARVAAAEGDAEPPDALLPVNAFLWYRRPVDPASPLPKQHAAAAAVAADWADQPDQSERG